MCEKVVYIYIYIYIYIYTHLVIYLYFSPNWKAIATNKLRGLSPRANYTDRATAAFR
jgi:hypothetical protein